MASNSAEKRKASNEENELTQHDKTTSASASSSSEINAFTALMTSKPQPKKTKYSDLIRNGLGVYLDRPETFPPSEVIGFNESAVYIWDLYPKGSVHALIIPRDIKKRDMNPYDAFGDKKFADEMAVEAQKLKTLVAKELKRMYGKYSETDKKRAEYETRLANGEVKEGEEVPEGRNWEAEVKVGFHSRPSMNHLHLHVISRDCHSPSLKKGQHYSEDHHDTIPLFHLGTPSWRKENLKTRTELVAQTCTSKLDVFSFLSPFSNSFNTSFFVELKDLPFGGKLAEDARKALADSEVAGPYICWRCKKSFDRRFKELKTHLEIEYEAWKKE